MFAKVLSISDELMWRYYLLLTDLAPAELEREKQLGRPMGSKIGLARRVVADFHGPAAAEKAEAEWRRVHQARQAPSDMPEKTIPPGRHKWRELLVMAGFAPSNGAAERLVRQRAVKKDGVVVEGGELEAEVAQSFVVSVGAARFVRFRVERA
jgi:tyrosyl-tRNA synthetase